MKLDIAFIDTFTSVAFKGNPTAVCKTVQHLDKQRMVSIAGEFNCPVTAFISRKTSGHSYDIRYFTTTTEIPACGHATLAAARMIMDESHGTSVLDFHTVTGTQIQSIREGSNILMRYPSYGTEMVTVSDKLLASLQLTDVRTAGYCPELETLFLEIEDPQAIRTIEPDY